MKNVVELIRVSTEQQACENRAGIPAQREVNRKTARIYGLTIVRSIEIVDVSGASVLKSPEMGQLLQFIESPDVHGVVAKEFSRLMRPENFADFALLQAFVDSNTALYLPEGPIDFGSKAGRLMGTIRAAMAGMERREIIERMQDAKEAMRRAGKHPGGNESLPFGVGYSSQMGWYYTADAEKVRAAFNMFLAGKTSYTAIGNRLNIPRTNVRFLLENPIYSGWRVYDERRDPSPHGYVPRPDGRQGYRRKMNRNPDEVIRVRVLDGFVADDDFARVQQMIEIKRQKNRRARNEDASHYTYNGFLTCGECQNPIYTHTSKDDFYQCKSSNPRERRKRAIVGLGKCNNQYMLRKKLEPKIDHLLCEKLQDRDYLQRVVDDYNGNLVPQRVATDSGQVLPAKLDALQEKRRRVLESFFEGVITREERNRKIQEIDHDTATFQDLMVEDGRRNEQRSLDDIRAAIEPLAEWEFLERNDKRELLASICPEIAVFRYTINAISLNLQPVHSSGNEVSRLKKVR